MPGKRCTTSMDFGARRRWSRAGWSAVEFRWIDEYRGQIVGDSVDLQRDDPPGDARDTRGNTRRKLRPRAHRSRHPHWTGPLMTRQTMRIAFAVVTLIVIAACGTTGKSTPPSPTPSWQDEPLPPMVSPNALCAILSAPELDKYLNIERPDTWAYQWGNLPACQWSQGYSLQIRGIDGLTSYEPDQVFRTYRIGDATARVISLNQASYSSDELGCTTFVSSPRFPPEYSLYVEVRAKPRTNLCETTNPLVSKVLDNIMLK